MHLSRNCPFSSKTNLHLELPGRMTLFQESAGQIYSSPRAFKFGDSGKFLSFRKIFSDFGLPQKGVHERGSNSLILHWFAFVCVCSRLCAFLCIVGSESASLKSALVCVCVRLLAFLICVNNPLPPFYYTPFAAPWWGFPRKLRKIPKIARGLLWADKLNPKSKAKWSQFPLESNQRREIETNSF